MMAPRIAHFKKIPAIRYTSEIPQDNCWLCDETFTKDEYVNKHHPIRGEPPYWVHLECHIVFTREYEPEIRANLQELSYDMEQIRQVSRIKRPDFRIQKKRVP